MLKNEDFPGSGGGILAHKLWTVSTMEAIGSLFMLFMVLRASKRMGKIVENTDKSAVTMSDYTVMVEVKCPLSTRKLTTFHAEMTIID